MRRRKENPLRLTALAELLGASIESTSGDTEALVLENINTLEFAGPSDVAFVGNEKLLAGAQTSKAGAFLVAGDVRIKGATCLVVEHVWKAALKTFDIWYPDEKPAPGIHPSAVVAETAQVDPTAYIGPLTVVEAGACIAAEAEIGAQCFIGRDARIGAGSLLHPQVRVLERVEVGCGVILHCGVVLGADGFGYEVIDGRGVKIPQVGTVIVGDDVEIGANSCVDRAFLRTTTVGMGTKIDNLVQVGHNVQIGRCCGIAAQAGVGGSTTLEDGVMIWGQVGVPDHLTVGTRAELLGQCGPTCDVEPGTRLFGTPAVDAREFARRQAIFRKLPDMAKRLKAVEKEIKNLRP